MHSAPSLPLAAPLPPDFCQGAPLESGQSLLRVSEVVMTSQDLFHWIIPMVKRETPEMQKSVVFALGNVAFPELSSAFHSPFPYPRYTGRIPEFPGGAAVGAEGGGGQERDCQTTEAALWNASRVGTYSADERVPPLLHPVPSAPSQT